MKMDKFKKKDIRYLLVAVLIIAICAVGYIVFKQSQSGNDKNFVEMGYIENSKGYTGYLIKEETVIDIDYSKTSVPVIAEGQRASKGQIIAMYRGEDFVNISEKLAKMDTEILEIMENLPEIYASEVQAMDFEILNNIKEVEGETSYIKVQDTKALINNLLNKRAKVVAENSPEGAAVLSLINARNEYEKSTKTSKDNIRATIGGVISYKLDGLETSKAFANLGAISISDVREKAKDSKISNGIKIVNNYEAYLIIEVKDIDKKYLEVGKTNKIRIVGLQNLELEGKIYRTRELNENSYEVMYKITNKIEDIANFREIEVEIVWVSNYGLFVPNDSINVKDEVSYVTVIKYGEYVDVPVNISRKNDKYSIVTNIENKKELKGTWDGYNIKVYDQLIIPKKK